MKQTEEQKALQACANYARLTRGIEHLTAAVGEALRACPGPDVLDESDRSLTHLSVALRATVVLEDTGERRRQYDEEITAEVDRCPHCAAAFHAIKARKYARRCLGQAKRVIGAIGGRANAVAAAEKIAADVIAKAMAHA